MLVCESISKSYENEVLSNFNLEVGSDEIVALLGPSGSGKSTLLRIICGLENSDSGKVFFNGIDLEEIPPEKRGIGMVFQNLALFPHLNVHDNLKFGLPPNSSITRISEILELVGLKNFGPRKIQHLSGGESQRVALARSLIAEPKMILLDEPLSSLDAGIKESLSLEVRKMIKSLSIPAIYVTHDPIIANQMADRIVYLESNI
jgi:ABC-type Fe3+/spermidine/putrescine transport system ATPase subunit|tara:strand:- start:6408 stop:7019 length:612 start_codon:yes stop_codon:yes gene_type:complete